MKTQKTAQEIVAHLPSKCYATLPSTGELIIITAGESGYYKLARADGSPCLGAEAIADADRLNAELGISLAQREAMFHGSMFGWGCKAADPDNYDAAGHFKTR